MPLHRFILKNEYGLGQPGLYRDANRDDPASVLDGVAASGLVGLLRQLGDLAEFSIEVCGSLQEQVDVTASRNRNLTMRVKRLEDALPSLEKAVLAQTSHIHFAYTTGCDWHAHIEYKNNNLNRNNLPRFITDNYEACGQTPHLHLLDRFDVNGPGSCLKRYSDPTLFRSLSSYYDRPHFFKSQIYKKARRTKKRRPSSRIKDNLIGASVPGHDGWLHTASSPNVQSFVCLTSSTSDAATTKCDLSKSIFDTVVNEEYIECIFSSVSSLHEGETTKRACSRSGVLHGNIRDMNLGQRQHEILDFLPSQSLLGIKDVGNLSDDTHDEKKETKHQGDEHPLLPEVHSGRVHETVQKTDQEEVIYERTKHEMTHSDIILCDNGTIEPVIVFPHITSGNEHSEPETVKRRICYDIQKNEKGNSITDIPSAICEIASDIIDLNSGCGIKQIEAENGKIAMAEYSETIMTEITEPNGEGKQIFGTEKFEPLKSITLVPFKFETIFSGVVGSPIPFKIEGTKPGKVEVGVVGFSSEEVKPELFYPHFINGSQDQALEDMKQDSDVNREDCEPETDEPVDLGTFYDSEYVCNNDYMFEEVKNGNTAEKRTGFVQTYASCDTEGVRKMSEIESESESYLDALNTTESESDSDTMCEPKLEVDEFSCCDSVGSAPDGVAEPVLPPSVDILSDFESVNDESLCLAESETFLKSTEILSEQKTIATVMKSDELCSPPETDIGEDTACDHDDSVLELFSSHSVSSRSMASTPHIMIPEKDVSSKSSTPSIFTPEKEVTSFHQLQDNSTVESSTLPSAILWTNGGLLGLQPSKPTDCVSVKTSQNEQMNAVKDGVIVHGESIVLCGKYETCEGPSVLKGGSQMESLSVGSSGNLVGPNEDIDFKLEAPHKYQMDSTFSQDDTVTVDCARRGDQTSNSDVKATISDSKLDNGGSIGFFDAGVMIYRNGYQRKQLPILDVVPEPTVSHCNLIGGYTNSEDQTCDFASFPPSPPLEPIKIAFHPTGVFDNRELKLKFIDRSGDRECIKDVLHSFELVCEPPFPLPDLSCDSVDKTASESSGCGHEDCLCSDDEPISEKSETQSSDICKCDEHSTGGSVFEYSETEQMANTGVGVDNKIEYCFMESAVELPFSQFEEIPHFESVDPSLGVEMAGISDQRFHMASKHSTESDIMSPAPQKTTETPCLDSFYGNGNEESLPELKSNFEKQNIFELSADPPLKQQGSILKWDEEDETHPDPHNKGIKPKHDFLHQIRSKSFNLRQPQLKRPILTRNTSVGVATILEKALSIRKAVASDGEDTDNWSDS